MDMDRDLKLFSHRISTSMTVSSMHQKINNQVKALHNLKFKVMNYQNT